MSSPAATPTAPRLLEPVTAALLGLAAVLTAVAAYLSGVQAGDEDAARARSIELNSRANALTNEATQVRAADSAMFAAWAEAGFGDNEDLTDYLLTLMRPELRTAVEAWAESDADTPFEEPSYTIQAESDAEASFAEAAEHDADAQQAAEKGDGYDKSTIFLALALFFAGIASTFRSRRFAYGSLAVSTLALAAGGLQLLTV